MASYTYGPLLGLFAFGLLTKRSINDQWYTTLLICIASPLLTLLISSNSELLLWGYKFSFEILPLNGLICFLGLLAISNKKSMIISH
jgi:hypothetical protein